MHFSKDIVATYELFIHKKLGDSWPIRYLSHLFPNPLFSKHIHIFDLHRVLLKNFNHKLAEPTLRVLPSAFHKHHYLVLLYDLFETLLYFQRICFLWHLLQLAEASPHHVHL